MHALRLVLLSDNFAVCRLPAGSPIPAWAIGELVSITRTAEELSIVCRADAVPDSVRRETDWRCLRVDGALDLSLVGVLAALAAPLAEAGVSVFAVSTFDTDYLLVKEANLARAIEALRMAGHSLQTTE
jgi:hypothetical protein